MIHFEPVRRLLLLSPLALCALASPALPCSPPPQIWSIVHVWPPEGVPVPPAGGVVLTGHSELGFGWQLIEAIRVEATMDGAPVESELSVGAFNDEAIWRPAGGFVEGARYRLRAEVENRDLEWYSGELAGALEVELERVAGPASYGGEAAAEAAEATAWTVPVVQCVREAPLGSCEYCEEERTVGSRDLLRIEVTLARPADVAAGGYLGGIRVAPDRAGLAGRGPAVARRFRDEPSLRLRNDLRDLVDWPTDEVCFQPVLITPIGETIEGAPGCVGIADQTSEIEPDGPEPEEPDEPEPDLPEPDLPEPDRDDGQEPPADHDAERGRSRNSGCGVGAGGGGFPALAALLLAGVLRRRSRG